MADVFVSYSSQDSRETELVVAALKGRGWSVWWDEQISAGRRFRNEITTQLDQARCIVVLWSRHSVDSDFVSDEADVGRRQNKLVQGVFDSVEPPLGFQGIQYAELKRPETGATVILDMEALLRGVAECLDPAGRGSVPSRRTTLSRGDPSSIDQAAAPNIRRIILGTLLMGALLIVAYQNLFPRAGVSGDVLIATLIVAIGGAWSVDLVWRRVRMRRTR